ncbi:MAG: hypothetical protein IJE46_07255 [Clostridia bacterium]|nr:hypothetical protein [Clostridia bacterium]
MVKEDTVKLLRECNLGIKMGIGSLNDVLDKVENKDLEDKLKKSRNEHEDLETETQMLLNRYGDEEKQPNIMAKGMSWIKTNVMLGIDESDKTVAGLITDGCNMGIKTINGYLNEYSEADEKIKDIAYKIIDLENTLLENVKEYL